MLKFARNQLKNSPYVTKAVWSFVFKLRRRRQQLSKDLIRIIGEKRLGSHLNVGLFNPWRFANRREVEGLSLFTHRLYHPQLRRWMTADPLGFQEGLNLYHYAHNNPFYYKDLDGQFAIVIPVITFTNWPYRYCL